VPEWHLTVGPGCVIRNMLLQEKQTFLGFLAVASCLQDDRERGDIEPLSSPAVGGNETDNGGQPTASEREAAP
jgi:hypothetical protein